MEQFSKFIDMIVENLSDSAKSDIVVGEPIEKADVTIIPLTQVSVGFGGGGGEGEGTEHVGLKGKKETLSGKGFGGGAGGGAKVSPVGVIIFDKDGVHVQPIISKVSPLEKIFDKIPELIEMAKDA